MNITQESGTIVRSEIHSPAIVKYVYYRVRLCRYLIMCYTIAGEYYVDSEQTDRV
jgi:hypothetical protein